ncbi:tachykinin-like peptides receptor 99D [Anthonomus grandis grandis]|uniref:tachykinin-like peptides receptor 99D n=1 Tax=Anthonomus grandis grandis TaxID=2921223 RepID=UPI002164F10D|nr:tachykinin-like peptides receptor 99D [Anthonomus grandis grandis]
MGSGGSRIDDSLRKDVTEDFFKPIHFDKTVYYWVILLVSVVSVVGHLFAIRVVLLRKYKYLQKTCIISLAFSDILTVMTFCLNNLDMLGKPLDLVWSFGEFICWYNPVGQVLGSMASSVALLTIALDRYHNVIYALNKKWDPKLWKCVLGAFVLWMVCLAISYPMSTFYFHIPMRLPSGLEVYMCTGTTSTRSLIGFYYLVVNILFFLPLVSMFFWFYYKIALLIWKHRKPVAANKDIEEYENSSSTKTSTENTNSSQIRKNLTKKRNLRMERKIRTFKIIIVLILAFLLCRMPYWLFCVIKLYAPIKNGTIVWKLNLSFTILNLLNCALNPFLYTFLNQTLCVFRKINDMVCTTVCCCFSNAEFESYERGIPLHEEVLGKIATIEQKKSDKPQVVGYIHQASYGPKYISVGRF